MRERSVLALAMILMSAACESRDVPDAPDAERGLLDVGPDVPGHGDHGDTSPLSNCFPLTGGCDATERCATVTRFGEVGYRCTSEPGELAVGDACANDIPVPFDGSTSARISRCAEGLRCAIQSDRNFRCELDCTVQMCPDAPDCDPLTQAPCEGFDACRFDDGRGAYRCVRAPVTEPGAACFHTTECGRGLSCLDGRCRPLCSATVPCADGATCVTRTNENYSEFICASDFASNCEMTNPADCGEGEQCAWGSSGGFATRCVALSETLAEGAECALDVLSLGGSFLTSRCGAGLACASAAPRVHTCVRPCNIFGCAAGEVCPGPGAPCVRSNPCEGESNCAPTEVCLGFHSGEAHCVPMSPLGGTCVSSPECSTNHCVDGHCVAGAPGVDAGPVVGDAGTL
jgi:hypothetical protein